jgi:hypothetical protein
VLWEAVLLQPLLPTPPGRTMMGWPALLLKVVVECC